MRLLKNGEFLDDGWVKLDDEESVPQGADIIVNLERLQQEFKTLKQHEGQLGVALSNTQDIADVADFLDALDTVVLSFPAFTDGRAYSQARRLREEFAYAGELRGTGNVLPDQLAFMRQCGIDCFEVSDRFDANVWLRAATAMTLTYQGGYAPERGFAPADVWSAREENARGSV